MKELYESAIEGDFRAFKKGFYAQMSESTLQQTELARQEISKSVSLDLNESNEDPAPEDVMVYSVSEVEDLEEAIKSMGILGVSGELFEDELQIQVENTEDNAELMEYWCKRFGATLVEAEETE